MSRFGLLAVLNNREIDEREEKTRLAREGVQQDGDPHSHLVGRFSSYIESCWQSAKDAKSPVELEMLEDLRQREGVYSPSKLQSIREQGGSEIYMMLTNTKCRTAEGWFRDMLFPAGERPFYNKSTPIPELPGDVKDRIVQMVMGEAAQMIQSGALISEREVFERARDVGMQIKERLKQQAEHAAKMMEDKIDDVLIDGLWYEAMEDMLSDLVALPAGIIKGPVIRRKQKLQWQQDPYTGKWQPMASGELTPMFYSPSPMDIYPAPDSKGPEDGYLFELIPIRRGALFGMIGVPGYNEEQIRACLRDYSKGYRISMPIDQQRRELENNPLFDLAPEKTLDVLEFHASVPGSLLIEWGMDSSRVPDPEAEYEITAWKIGRYVVRCVLNEDPMKRRPYMICHFDKIKGSFWGRGLPRIIRDLQDMCNAAARALSNNMGLSSGPIMEVETDRLADGTDLTTVFPWMQIQTKSSKTTPAPAIRFHDIPSNAQELLAVYTYFSGLADQYSGIQLHDQGVNQRSGAAGTASGLAMLMNASGRQIKAIFASIDRVIVGSVERVHFHVMLNDPDESIKGDAQLEARGTSALVAKEQQQLRRGEFLAATNNPVDMAIIGPLGRAELLREAVKSFEFNPDLVIPGRDEVLRNMRAAMTQSIPQNPQAPAGMGGGQEADVAGNKAGGLNLVSAAAA